MSPAAVVVYCRGWRGRWCGRPPSPSTPLPQEASTGILLTHILCSQPSLYRLPLTITSFMSSSIAPMMFSPCHRRSDFTVLLLTWHLECNVTSLHIHVPLSPRFTAWPPCTSSVLCWASCSSMTDRHRVYFFTFLFRPQTRIIQSKTFLLLQFHFFIVHVFLFLAFSDRLIFLYRSISLSCPSFLHFNA